VVGPMSYASSSSDTPLTPPQVAETLSY
jgi:hypothetical protein